MKTLSIEEEKERKYYLSMILRYPKISLTLFAARIYDDKALRGVSTAGTSDSTLMKRLDIVGITYPYKTRKVRHEDSPVYTTIAQLYTAGFLEDYELEADLTPEVILIPEEEIVTLPSPEGKIKYIINGFAISSHTREAATAWYNYLTNH